MSCELQGIFVSEKIRSVRWIPNDVPMSPATHFLTAGWDNVVNRLRLWTMEDIEDPNGGIHQVASMDAPVGADWTALQIVGGPSGPQEIRAAAATSHGDALLVLPNIRQKPSIETLISWKNIHSFKDGTPAACTALAAMEGDIVTVGEDGRMNFLTSHQTQIVRTIENADSCTLHCVCFLKYNEVITGNLRGQMKIWDLRSQSKSPSATFSLGGDQVAATCIVHHPTQRHLVIAGSENGSLTVWDLRVDTYPASLLNAHSASVTDIEFHPDHPQRLFTCSANGEIWHWNTATMSKQITNINSAMSLNESAINPWLMTDEDKSNLEVMSIMSDLHKPINSLDCNKDKVVCGCDNEAVYVINNVFI